MNNTISTCLVLIPALPLLGAILVAILGAKVLKGFSHIPIIIALAGAFAASFVLLGEVRKEAATEAAQVAGFEQVVTLWNWADIPAAYDNSAAGGSDAGVHPFRIDITLRADPLTSMMLAMVTFVATLVAIFAAGYMHGEKGYWRFFAYIGLFVFSMTMLVSVSNFVLLFVFWEAVGVCSYLLIGFWYHKPEAAAAGMKAFLVNRVGDFGYALALFLIWTTYGSLNFHDSLSDGTTEPAKITAVVSGSAEATEAAAEKPTLVRGVLGKSRLTAGDYVTGGVASAICLLLMLGACGKSAQFPLHVWLPDAMEGPTPVSALIHAATMVTAGVYMVTRCTPLFCAAPDAQMVVAVIGGFTALLAGLIALTQHDLKRVLAYSTVSQLGFMFLSLGTGSFLGITGGMFHLFTHAFFKALLFLGSGSVMHAMHHIIDMRQFSGLRRIMPYTHATFLVGSLALAGIFPFAGFWSKDAVLGSVHDKIHSLEHELEHRAGHGDHGHASLEASELHLVSAVAKESAVASPLASWSDAQVQNSLRVYSLLYYGAMFTAFLTAFYTFRAFLLTFYGEEKVPEAAHHPHESPWLMVGPLVVLAVCAVLVGGYFVNLSGDWAQNSLVNFLGHTPSLATGVVASTIPAHPEFHLSVAGTGTAVAVAGLLLALYLYLGDRREVTVLQQLFNLQGSERLTDPQWVMQLEKIWWIGMITNPLRKVGLGFLVTGVGYLLGILTLVLFSAPLLIGNFVTPYRLSLNKFYLDEVYQWVFIVPLNLASDLLYWLDRNVVDGLVNFIGAIPKALGSFMRSMQMGLVQYYAMVMVLGALVLVAAKLLLAAG